MWWHLVTPESWPYFNQAITVGVGLNVQTTRARATQKWNQLQEYTQDRFGCQGWDCLRGLNHTELRETFDPYGVAAPIKLTLTSPQYTPVVDLVSLPGQLVDLVAAGHIRPNTPISFNYAENDAFGYDK